MVGRGNVKDYVGERYGLVTVLKRTGPKRVWVRCTCNMERSMYISNLVRHPPKKHSKCREPQLDLFS